MPYSSNQISGMVGGQMAMFSNQAQFAQQIGGMVGTSPMGMAGGMQNPYPREDIGAQVAGGMGMAIPGMGTGLAVAGSLMGGRLGWMDPITAGARGFAGGTAGMGAGFMETLGSVGRTFATGGVRAGMGALGGGIAGAAAAAAPALAIGAGLQFVGENVYQGAQNIAEVGGMANQYFGPQYGQPGARHGGQMARQEIKRVTSALREIVDDDTRTSMGELKRVMDQAGRMGMLTGIGSAEEFKTKFKNMVRQMRQVADFMGTSLEEVAPLMGQMRQMGLWSAGDVMGTLTAGRVAGAARPQMMQTMQAGAQMAHALGGNMGAGALTGRATFETIQAAQRGGFLSQEQLSEFTGGLTGAEGQRAAAQHLTGIMTNLGQTPAWRLMMAGLGQVENGKFTGEVDQAQLQRFLRGDITVGGLQRRGQGVARTQAGALSFHRVQNQLAQNMSSKGGLEAFQQIVNQVADRFGGDREEVTHRLLMQMGNMNEREASMMQGILRDLPMIRDQQARASRQAIDQAFQDADQRANRSWGAFKNSVSQNWEKVKRPFQEAGERLATDFGEVQDRLTDYLMGRVHRIPMGTQERMRLLAGNVSGAMTGMPSNMGQAWAEGDWMTNMNLRMRGGGFLGRAAARGAIGAGAGSLIPGVGSVAGGTLGVASAMFGWGEESTPRQQLLRDIGAGMQGGPAGNIKLGGGVTTTRTRIQEMVNRAYKRAGDPGALAEGIKKPKQLAKIQEKLTTIIAKHSAELSDLQKDDPRGYINRVMELMQDPSEGGDKDIFQGLDQADRLDYLAVAQKNEGLQAMTLDFKGTARDLGAMPTTPKELAEYQDKLLGDMMKIGGGRNIGLAMLEGAGAGALGGAIAGGGIGAIPGALLGAAAGGITAAVRDTGITRDMLEQAMTGAGSDIFARWTNKEIDTEQAKKELLKVPKGQGQKLIDLLDKIEKNKLSGQFQALGERFGATRRGQAFMEAAPGIQAAASQASAGSRLLGASSQEAYRNLRKQLMGAGDTELTGEEFEEAKRMTEEMARGLTTKDISRLQRGGGNAIERMVGAVREAQDIEKGTGEVRNIKKVLGRFRHLGIDLTQNERIQSLLQGGIQGNERAEFASIAKSLSKSSIAGSAEANNAEAQKMEAQLKYLTANTDFVKAVHQALGDKLEKAAKEVEAATKVAQPGGMQP
jgi:hypothetical protein